MYLSCCVRPYPDELFISYINRLAIYNSATGVHDFIRRFLYPSGRGSGNLLYPTDVISFTNRIRKNTGLFPDDVGVLAMIPYRAEAEGLVYKEQARLLESILYNNTRPSVPSLKSRHDISLRYCPFCVKEDKQNGIVPYLRLSHHLPDVQVCSRHHVPLVKIRRCLTDHRHKVFLDIDTTDLSDIPYDVPDVWHELQHANDMIRAQTASPLYEKVACKKCGSIFIAHPHSAESGVLCGTCMSRLSDADAVRIRLYALYGNEYHLEKGDGDLSRENVIHVPCSNTLKRPLLTLIYGDRRPCGKCTYNTPEKLQKLIPDRFRILPFERKGRIWQTAVLDTKCQNEFMATLQTFIKEPRCPVCEPKQKVIDMKEYFEYDVLEYTNNRTKMLLQHKKCGAVYRTTKTAFLNGALCPICTPRYNTDVVMNALQSCTQGAVTAKPSSHRGCLSITLPDGEIRFDLTFRIVMHDLSAEKPTIIKCRKVRYHIPETKAHMVFVSVKKAEEENGCWVFQDGIINENGEAVEIDRCMRNYIQGMVQSGHLVRINKGKYRTANRNDWSTCKNRDK